MILYKNILPETEFASLYDTLCASPKWSYIGFSAEKKYTFWNMDLSDETFFSEKMFSIICQLTNLNFQLLRVYANGQTYGLPGDLHYDSNDNADYTFLFYVNKSWHASWGGQTVFCLDENKAINKLKSIEDKGHTKNNTITSFFPIPNSGILFKSNIAHVGLEPTRHCKELRITVAYKLKKIETRD